MRRWKYLGRVWMVAAFGFMYVPIAVLIAFSFNESKSRNVWAGFSLRWYKNLLGDEMILQALGVSLVVAFASAIIATVLGTLAAIGVNNMGRRTRAVVLNLSYVPIVNPEIVTGVATMLLFVVLNGTISDVLTALLGNEVRVGFGIGTLLIELLLNRAFALRDRLIWSYYPLTVLVLIGVVLFYIDCNKPLKERLARKFFI